MAVKTQAIRPGIRNQDELARHLGVTRLTVHRALTGRAGVGEARRRQVIEAARELGYRPNGAARAVVSGRFNSVALVLSTEGRRSTIFPGLIVGAGDALAEHDMHLTIARLPDEKLTDEAYMPRALREWTVDGLLINYNQEIPEKLVELVERHQIPSVWINSKQPADCVYPDDAGGARDATERLLALGHRRIAFVSFAQPLHYSGQDRRDGYEQAMRSAGLCPRFILQPHGGTTATEMGEDVRPAAIEILRRADRPTAIIAYAVREAAAMLHAAAWLHLDVPRDLSLITFAESIQDDTVMPLSKIWISRVALGRSAVEMLIKKINNPSYPLPPKAMPLNWWQGTTCGPCNPPECPIGDGYIRSSS